MQRKNTEDLLFANEDFGLGVNAERTDGLFAVVLCRQQDAGQRHRLINPFEVWQSSNILERR